MPNYRARPESGERRDTPGSRTFGDAAYVLSPRDPFGRARPTVNNKSAGKKGSSTRSHVGSDSHEVTIRRPEMRDPASTTAAARFRVRVGTRSPGISEP